jgi:hypothetical protein
MADADTMKDLAMNEVATRGGNVGMFASFAPDGTKRYSRIRGFTSDQAFPTPLSAIQALYSAGAENVNIRTFTPDQPDGNPFFYGPSCGFGREHPELATAKVAEMLAAGYHVIVNETIDVNDGGFSGVAYGDTFEFAACDTPRCVEKDGTATLPRDLALAFIHAIYRFHLHLPYASSVRVEFSVHPRQVGYLGQQVLIWQAEEHPESLPPRPEPPRWPNRYSQFLGDKAYGILLAHLHGIPVPWTAVFGRTIPFFEFGLRVNSGADRWVRTAPRVQVPGLFTTKRGWLDPFELMQREDPTNERIASILVQDGIASRWSGATLTTPDSEPLIEGQPGEGDHFMVGQTAPSQDLPHDVELAVRDLWWRLTNLFEGPVRFEWAYDGQQVWLLQLHVGASQSYGSTIYPGEPETWVEFTVTNGLEALRVLIERAQAEGFGIKLIGNVGITSHFGDVLRRGQVPSRIIRS